MTSVEYTYDGKFEGNILTVGQTGCGKTTFVQNLAKNDLFGELQEIFWMSKISLSSEREEDIKSCFKKHVSFKYLHSLEDFNMEPGFFQRKKEDSNCNDDILMGEDNVFNKLIVMDDVLDLADKSNNFAKFLTVSRKFSVTCVYVLHKIYPTRSNLQMIL